MTIAEQSQTIGVQARRRTRLTKKQLFIMGGVAIVAALILGLGGFSFVAAQEEQDSFCASCHTEPESTYYERSIAPELVDLATAHKHEEIRCIDCHSGVGLIGRVEAQVMGARNAAMWYTGAATQPAPLTIPIGDDHCVKCHADVTGKEYDVTERSKLFGPRGHYHTYLAQWRASDAQATTNCTTCHAGHDLGAEAKATWIVPAAVQMVCEGCHKVLDEP